jgi:hypothetical protein
MTQYDLGYHRNVFPSSKMCNSQKATLQYNSACERINFITTLLISELVTEWEMWFQNKSKIKPYKDHHRNCFKSNQGKTDFEKLLCGYNISTWSCTCKLVTQPTQPEICIVYVSRVFQHIFRNLLIKVLRNAFKVSSTKYIVMS